MNLTSLEPSDKHVLQLAMQYWAQRWDWECPLLFGIELQQLQEVLAHWPAVPDGAERTTALALLSSLTEPLYGASAAPKESLQGLVGVPYERAHTLCSKVAAICRPMI